MLIARQSARVCKHGRALQGGIQCLLPYAYLRLFGPHRSLAGCGPAATHFLCFAKESKQRKATTLPLAFGFPIARVKKWESFETRFAQTAKFSLSIFCLTQLAVSEVD